MNPFCPKCGRLMRLRKRESNSNKAKEIRGTLSKYWICPNRSPEHGLVSFKAGAGAII